MSIVIRGYKTPLRAEVRRGRRTIDRWRRNIDHGASWHAAASRYAGIHAGGDNLMATERSTGRDRRTC
jgi:hypothetical protein